VLTLMMGVGEIYTFVLNWGPLLAL